jgi:SAM-dependent methyltransferase
MAVGEAATILEVGSLTGQHACFFASQRVGWRWHPSDRDPERLEWVRERARREQVFNVAEPVVFDLLVGQEPQIEGLSAIVAINVIHIAPWEACVRLFEYASRVLGPGGVVFLYGPMRDERWALEPSNAAFDHDLRSRGGGEGLRLFQEVDALARGAGFVLVEERAMPANNRSCWWERRG